MAFGKEVLYGRRERWNRSMRKRYRPPPPVPGAFGFPLGFVAGIAATGIAVIAGATQHPVVSVVLLAVAVAGVSAVTTPAAATATGAVSWFLHDGFVLGRHGALAFTAVSARAALVLVSVAVVTALIAAAVRMVEFRRTLSSLLAHLPAQRDVGQHPGRAAIRR
jgi:hypothetical protein